MIQSITPTRIISSKPQKELTLKAWLKMVNSITDPYYCEALITSLEARRRQLRPDFKSETPLS